MERLEQEILKDAQNPDFAYPADHKYLSENRLKRDLLILDSVLECYKREGVGRIMLEYD